MADTEFDIINRALVQCGANPIAAYDDSTEGVTAKLFYEATVAARLSARKWTFATEQWELNRLLSTPRTRWSVAWQLPTAALKVWWVGTGADSTVKFDHLGDKIFTDEGDILFCEATFRQVEAKWPADFTELIVTDLGAIFARAIPRDLELAKDFRAEAVELRGPIARSTDSMTRSTRRLRGSRLIAVRR
jgi:hypothetical protein